MKTPIRFALGLAILGAVGATTASVAGAQDNAVSGIMIRGWQGSYITLPITTPAPATVYSLTGETNTNAASAKTWQHQAGPVFQFGNGSVILPAGR